MTTGEGGMVTTHSEDEWRLLRSLRNQGSADSGGWLEHARLGFNYRIDDIRAALGLGQLERLDEILSERAAVAARYTELLSDIDGLELPCADDADHERSWFVYVVALPRGHRSRGGDRGARCPRRPDRPLPPVHPPSVVHAGALRLSRRPLPGRGGRELAHARAALPRASRRGRPAARGGGAARSSVRTDPSQGEALGAWALWGAVSLAVLITYSRLDATELYNVSHEGLAGGLGRALVLVNFPVALVAVALALLAVAALPAKAWLLAGPAIGLCAMVPFTVDQDDLNARWINAFPALGVVLALCLTIAAARRAGTSFAPRRAGDPLRLVVAAVVVLLSLPWVAAELGFHLPGDIFLGEELYLEEDGRRFAAVHLGHHHGGDGAVLVLTALLLSRVRLRPGSLRLVVTAYLGVMLAYGAVNLAQDLWHEQVVKRGWTDVDIPSALLPGPRPIWLVIVVLAVVAAVVLLREDDGHVEPAPT